MTPQKLVCDLTQIVLEETGSEHIWQNRPVTPVELARIWTRIRMFVAEVDRQQQQEVTK